MSISDRPHLRRLVANPRAGICVDVEDPERTDGQRPNRQVGAIGIAELSPDHDGRWTTRISDKYVRGPAALRDARGASGRSGVVIRLTPDRLVAVASV
jgi:hypothetical protein